MTDLSRLPQGQVKGVDIPDLCTQSDAMTTTTYTPLLPARTTPAPAWKWSTDDLRIARREDDALAAADLDDCIRRCLAEGVS